MRNHRVKEDRTLYLFDGAVAELQEEHELSSGDSTSSKAHKTSLSR